MPSGFVFGPALRLRYARREKQARPWGRARGASGCLRSSPTRCGVVRGRRGRHQSVLGRCRAWPCPARFESTRRPPSATRPRPGRSRGTIRPHSTGEGDAPRFQSSDNALAAPPAAAPMPCVVPVISCRPHASRRAPISSSNRLRRGIRCTLRVSVSTRTLRLMRKSSATRRTDLPDRTARTCRACMGVNRS